MVNMGKDKLPFIFLFFLWFFAACGSSGEGNYPTYQGSNSGLVLISTSYGDIKIKLYEETPRHRENFLKLVGESFYDSTTFHRVEGGSLIQGGDPFSRTPGKQDSIGLGGPGYELKEEIHPNLIHKYGAVAAARTGDYYNKFRNSAGSQFYIIIGKKWTGPDLDLVEKQTQDDQRSFLYLQIMNRDGNEWMNEESQDRLYKENPDSFQLVMDSLDVIYERELAALQPFTYTPEQRMPSTTSPKTVYFWSSRGFPPSEM